MAVNATDADTNGEEEPFLFLKVDGNDGVALFRSHADGIGTVALMQCHFSFSTLESYHLVAWQWMTAGATNVWHLFLVSKMTAESSLCLVGQYVFQPFFFGQGILVCPYLYAVTSTQHGLHRTESAIDAGILRMESYLTVNLKGKVQCRSVREE